MFWVPKSLNTVSRESGFISTLKHKTPSFYLKNGVAFVGFMDIPYAGFALLIHSFIITASLHGSRVLKY